MTDKQSIKNIEMYPGPRHSHSAVHYKNRIIIFGGKVNMFENTNKINVYYLDTK